MIAVIIPTKNTPQYLKECLASFVSNECPFYIRVIDDNSDDWEANQDVCFRFDDLLNIHYRRFTESDTPGQILSPVKTGIETSLDADYIKIFGSDDFLEPHALDYEYTFMKKHEDKFDAVLTSYVETNETLQLTPRVYRVHEKITIPLMKNGCYITDGLLVKRRFFNNVVWDTTIGSRWLWRIWFEMICKGLRVYSIPDFISQRYRRHGNNMSDRDGYRTGEAELPRIFNEIERQYNEISDNRNNRQPGCCPNESDSEK